MLPDQSITVLQNALRFTFGSGAIFGTIFGVVTTILFVRMSLMRTRIHHLLDCWLFRRAAFGEFLAIMSAITLLTIICAMWWGVTPPNVGKLMKLIAT